MSFKQHVEEHLAHFAKNIGMGNLTLNDQDACGLCFDDTMIVNIEYLKDDEAIVFVAAVRPMDAHGDSKLNLYEKMLATNLQHFNMQGSAFCLNNDMTEVLLLCSVPASCDYALFETTLEKFVNTLEWAKKELHNAEHDSISSNNSADRSDRPSAPDIGVGMMV